MIEIISSYKRRDVIRLVECPACGADLRPDTPYAQTVPPHIESHDPEDFGLSPLLQLDSRL